jgi:hypothetical protein
VAPLLAHIRRCFYFKDIVILSYNFNIFYHKVRNHMLNHNLISAFYFLNLFGSGRMFTKYMFYKKTTVTLRLPRTRSSCTLK